MINDIAAPIVAHSPIDSSTITISAGPAGSGPMPVHAARCDRHSAAVALRFRRWVLPFGNKRPSPSFPVSKLRRSKANFPAPHQALPARALARQMVDAAPSDALTSHRIVLAGYPPTRTNCAAPCQSYWIGGEYRSVYAQVNPRRKRALKVGADTEAR